MDNERILEAARNNKQRGKEYENRESVRSSLYGVLAAIPVTFGLLFIEYIAKRTVNAGLIAVFMTMAGVQSLHEGIKLKKIYLKAVGTVCALIALCAVLAFIGQVV